MRNLKKLVLLLGLGALLQLSASAKTLEDAYIESCRKGPGIPVPIVVVAPHVDSYDIGEAVEVVFVVDTTGHPSDISVKSASDKSLAAAVVAAVKQWRFSPATRDGTPVATKVTLPFNVIEGEDSTIRLAAN